MIAVKRKNVIIKLTMVIMITLISSQMYSQDTSFNSISVLNNLERGNSLLLGNSENNYIKLGTNLGNEFIIRNTKEIRFSDANTWDYADWAGLKYNNIDRTIFFGGSGGSVFNTGGAPRFVTIDMTKANSGVEKILTSKLTTEKLNFSKTDINDFAFIESNVEGSSTFLDMVIYDDAVNDAFRWQFNFWKTQGVETLMKLTHSGSITGDDTALLTVNGKVDVNEMSLTTTIDQKSKIYAYNTNPNSGDHEQKYLEMSFDPNNDEFSWNHMWNRYYDPSFETVMKLKYIVNNDGSNIGLLSVVGSIEAKEIKVHVNAGADYVLENGYEIKDLLELEVFLNKNNHLPEIKSAEQMVKEGINLSEMSILLLKKIEELTLYTIDQEKRIINKNKNINKLEGVLELQKQLLKRIEKLENK